MTTTTTSTISSRASSSSASKRWTGLDCTKMALAFSLAFNVVIMTLFHQSTKFYDMTFDSSVIDSSFLLSSLKRVGDVLPSPPLNFGSENGTFSFSSILDSYYYAPNTPIPPVAEDEPLPLSVVKRFEGSVMPLTARKCKLIWNAEFSLSNYTEHSIVPSLSDLTMHFDHPTIRFDIREITTTTTTTSTNISSNTPQYNGYATCVRKPLGWEEHFPHWFQQITRCWNFWQLHPHLRPIWITTTDDHRYNDWIRRFIDLLPTMGVLPILKNETSGQVQVINGHFEGSNPTNNIESISLVQSSDDSSVTAYSMPTWASNVGFQSTSPSHMMSLRNAFLNAVGYQHPAPQPFGCPAMSKVTSSSSSATNPPVPRIAMINRKGSRKLNNGWEIVVDLTHYLNLTYQIPELYLEGKDLDQQATVLADIDILITPHGAQETNIVFMPKCGAILEFLPEQWFIPKYFGSLAASSGLDHAVIHMARNLTDKSLVGPRKHESMCVPLESTRYSMSRLVERWQRCCQRAMSGENGAVE